MNFAPIAASDGGNVRLNDSGLWMRWHDGSLRLAGCSPGLSGQ